MLPSPRAYLVTGPDLWRVVKTEPEAITLKGAAPNRMVQALVLYADAAPMLRDLTTELDDKRLALTAAEKRVEYLAAEVEMLRYAVTLF